MWNLKLSGFKQTVKKINALGAKMEKLTEEDMRDKAVELKGRAVEGESLDNLLVEAFALVREAAKCTLGYGHYDVQLLGGIALHKGYLAAFLNALSGKGVHVVTVNDYLAVRDCEWMGRIHRMLGLSVGCVVSGMSMDERKKAYACDITYVTNTMTTHKAQGSEFAYVIGTFAMDQFTMLSRAIAYMFVTRGKKRYCAICEKRRSSWRYAMSDRPGGTRFCLPN